MTKRAINNLMDAITRSVSDAGFYEPKLQKKKNKHLHKFEYLFSIKQKSQDFAGYRIYYFRIEYIRTVYLDFSLTKEVDEKGNVLSIGSFPPSNPTALRAYATIATLLSSFRCALKANM